MGIECWCVWCDIEVVRREMGRGLTAVRWGPSLGGLFPAEQLLGPVPRQEQALCACRTSWRQNGGRQAQKALEGCWNEFCFYGAWAGRPQKAMSKGRMPFPFWRIPLGALPNPDRGRVPFHQQARNDGFLDQSKIEEPMKQKTFQC